MPKMLITEKKCSFSLLHSQLLQTKLHAQVTIHTESNNAFNDSKFSVGRGEETHIRVRAFGHVEHTERIDW